MEVHKPGGKEGMRRAHWGEEETKTNARDKLTQERGSATEDRKVGFGKGLKANAVNLSNFINKQEGKKRSKLIYYPE